MLSDLQEKDFKLFQKFCTAQVACRQPHVVNLYLSTVKTPQSGSTATTDSAVNLHYSQSLSYAKLACLKEHWNDMKGRVDCDEELLAEIGSHSIFTAI